MRTDAKKIAIRGILIALIMIQSFVPFLGYIPLGITNITIIHITAITAAIILGPVDGLLVGFSWGFLKFIIAFIAPNSVMDTLVFRNPLISILPRALVGLFAGIIFIFIYKWSKNQTIAMVCAAITGTLTNTILVLSMMALIYPTQTAGAYGVNQSLLLKTLGGIVITNGLPEIIAAIIIVPIVCKALLKATKLAPSPNL